MKRTYALPRKALHQTVFYTALFTLLAHGYRLLNMSFSGDASLIVQTEETFRKRPFEREDIPLANALLGREFRYKNVVVDGQHRGRLIGAPTINQRFDQGFVKPKKGVYASVTVVDGKEYPSVTNIGLRPSFENEDFRSETCILGFSGNLYGQDIEVRLLRYLRDEIKFDSIEALGVQISKDAEESMKIFSERGESGNV